jgi:hypothetical protein
MLLSNWTYFVYLLAPKRTPTHSTMAQKPGRMGWHRTMELAREFMKILFH